MESTKRSLYKTVSWHVLHMFMVALVAFIVTESIKLATILASAELIWESFAYFAHERVWAKFGNKVK
jgi:uncharacterized membrane protein